MTVVRRVPDVILTGTFYPDRVGAATVPLMLSTSTFTTSDFDVTEYAPAITSTA